MLPNSSTYCFWEEVLGDVSQFRRMNRRVGLMDVGRVERTELGVMALCNHPAALGTHSRAISF